MRESKQRLDAQRQEYEGAIARHQVILRITGVSFSLDCSVRILGECFDAKTSSVSVVYRPID